MKGAEGPNGEVRLAERIGLFAQDEYLVAAAREIWEIVAPRAALVARPSRRPGHRPMDWI